MGLNVTSNKDQTVQERVNKVISELLGITTADIKPESNLEDDLGADSLDAVEIVMGLEDEFEIEVEDEVAEQWKTVQDIYTHFEKL